MQNRMIATDNPKAFFYVIKIELDEVSTTAHGRLIHIHLGRTSVEDVVIKNCPAVMDSIDLHFLKGCDLGDFEIIETIEKEKI